MPIISSLKIDISVTVAALAHSAAMRALSVGTACSGGTGQAPGGTGAAWGLHRAAPWAAPGGRPRPVRAGALGRPGGAWAVRAGAKRYLGRPDGGGGGR